ncbi:MAG: histidinol dehydrogenase [Armatimonadetes bacterium]|nr:histidinol dehydrogenase [Armatimonadota bacterium]
MPETLPVVRRLAELPAEERRRRLQRSSGVIFSEETRRYALRVLDEVARDGDTAVAAYTARWDGVHLSPEQFAVRPDEFRAAHRAIDAEVRQALAAAIARCRRYNEWLRPPAAVMQELEPGLTVGIQYRPCRSAGIYVPSGKGSFPSMVVSQVTPAVVAGVDAIIVVVPPRADGSVDPAVLVAADLLGVRQIYRCNGAAGVAALAVGTATIPRTDVVVGPGNPVIAAVQQAAAAYGARPLVLLGPSESIVLADETADPARLAVDLLNEAEHGADSAVMLVATAAGVAEQTVALLPRYLERLPEPRRAFALAALTDLGGVFVADGLDQAIEWINAYAPEHLQIAVRDPLEVASRIHHAGEILIGQSTPFAAANYAIGVPAALPTGGAAVAASGITVLSYLKTTSIASLTPDGLRVVAPVVTALGRYEGFPAHVQAITEREGDAR